MTTLDHNTKNKLYKIKTHMQLVNIYKNKKQNPKQTEL